MLKELLMVINCYMDLNSTMSTANHILYNPSFIYSNALPPADATVLLKCYM